MEPNRATVKDATIAKELEGLTSQYQADLCRLIEKARSIEGPDDHKTLTRAIGEVLASLGQCILFPMCRQHPELTPAELKETIQREAQQESEDDGGKPSAS